MLESSINNRIKFNKKGVQRKFILEAKDFLGMNGREFAEKLKISQRTLTAWAHEKIKISFVVAQRISKLTHIQIPKNHRVINWRAHLQKAGKIGGRNRFIKYGSVATDEMYRKSKWKEWWKITGQYKKTAPGFQTLIKIKIPRKSILLAEFVGIMLGDGGVNPYHISVTLSVEEKEYILYVDSVIRKLFGVIPKIHKHKHAKAVSIFVNRKQLVNFCQEIGLVKGNKVKQQVDIPKWIKENKKFSIACIRGLIDTDGCFYTNSYHINGKKYSYFKIAFISASKPLADSVADTLINLGINARIDRKHRDVRIVDNQSVHKYMNKISSHNKKHLLKINKWRVAPNGKATVC